MKALRVTPALGRAIVRGTKVTHRIPAGRAETCPIAVNKPPRVVRVDGAVYTGPEPGLYRLEYPQTLTGPYGDPINDRHGHARVTYTTNTVLRVIGTHRERLEDITDETAALEGFDSFAAFLDYWMATHNPYPPDHPKAREFFTERRMRSYVWVIRFVAEQQDTIHLLPNLPGEPEAVDPAIQLGAAGDARRGWARGRARLDARYADMTLGERVDAALRQAVTADERRKAFQLRRLAAEILERTDRAA